MNKLKCKIVEDKGNGFYLIELFDPFPKIDDKLKELGI